MRPVPPCSGGGVELRPVVGTRTGLRAQPSSLLRGATENELGQIFPRPLKAREEFLLDVAGGEESQAGGEQDENYFVGCCV